VALNAASELKLKRVKPDLVSVVRRAAEISTRPFQIVQGNRTQAEQNALYAQGRTKRGNIVTWTKKSKHIGGGAIDFAALVNGKVSWNEKLFPAIADAFKQAARELKTGIEWGGDWKTKDWGHIQLTPKSPTPMAPTAGIGWTVTDIQNALIKHGFSPGMIDGIMGQKTHAALTAFQTANGLLPSGGPDKATTDALARPPVSAPMGIANLTPHPLPTGTPRWAVTKLQELGMSRLDAITYTANLVWESGGHDHINWSAHGDNNHSHGAGQWSDRHDRFDNLQALAAARGTTWDDPATQLQHLVNELKSTEVGAQRKVEAAATLKDKMQAALSYWRPSIPHEDRRLAIAEKLDKEIKDA
jgi:peptidoglycan L-alanyl-D-glutamate endopeptidase CwlK